MPVCTNYQTIVLWWVLFVFFFSMKVKVFRRLVRIYLDKRCPLEGGDVKFANIFCGLESIESDIITVAGYF